MSSANLFDSNRRKRISSEDRREQIITVAAKLFARKGFNGATTKEIAEEVAVSEAIIFRHFPSKQELYSTILECKSKEFLALLCSSSEEAMQSCDDHAVFVNIATEILEQHRLDPTLLRLLYYSALEGHEMAKRFFDTSARTSRELLVNYIKQRQENGAFRELNATVAARSFFALVTHRAVIRELFQDALWLKSSSHEAALEITDIFLHGLLSGKID